MSICSRAPAGKQLPDEQQDKGSLCQCASVVLSASSAPVSAALDNRCLPRSPQEQSLLIWADREPFSSHHDLGFGPQIRQTSTWNSIQVDPTIDLPHSNLPTRARHLAYMVSRRCARMRRISTSIHVPQPDASSSFSLAMLSHSEAVQRLCS